MNRLARRLRLLVFLLLPACQQQMASQPHIKPDEESSFFPDGRAARPPVSGTVARGHLRTDWHLYTGLRAPETAAWIAPADRILAGAANMPLTAVVLEAMREEDLVDTFPFPVTEKVLKHGKNRYMIYCVVCHDSLGTGRGMIVQRGYTQPPSYHIERLRQARVGHFFRIITLGYGSMPDYSAQISPRDRWAIVAYIRALQLSQHFPVDQLQDDLRQRWQGGQPQ